MTVSFSVNTESLSFSAKLQPKLHLFSDTYNHKSTTTAEKNKLLNVWCVGRFIFVKRELYTNLKSRTGSVRFWSWCKSRDLLVLCIRKSSRDGWVCCLSKWALKPHKENWDEIISAATVLSCKTLVCWFVPMNRKMFGSGHVLLHEFSYILVF